MLKSVGEDYKGIGKGWDLVTGYIRCHPDPMACDCEARRWSFAFGASISSTGNWGDDKALFSESQEIECSVNCERSVLGRD